MVGRMSKNRKGIIAFLMCLMMIVSVFISGENVKAATSREQLKAQIDAAEAELASLKTAQSEAATKRGRGTLGFVEYMLTKSNLTSAQKTDLNNAKTRLLDAMEEDLDSSKQKFTFPAFRNNKVVVLDDRYDAISLDNYPAMFKGLKAINEYRASDDLYVGNLKCNPAYTNFELTAIAQAGTNRGAAYTNHSVNYANLECLAFGYGDDGVRGWYSEKTYFLDAMQQLGMTTITSSSDVYKVESKAADNNKIVGHYTNMFYFKNQIMGVGFDKYGTYGDTMCYNAVSTSSGKAYYTIDQFEALFNEYYETVEPDQFIAAISAKEAELEALKQQYYATCPGHKFTTSGTKAADCRTEGYSWKKCSDCGYVQKSNIVPALGHDLTDGVCSRCGVKTVKTFSNVSWNAGSYYSYSENQSYEMNKEVNLNFYFTTAKDNKPDEEFVVEISDPTVASYTRKSNASGVMTMLKPGLCDVTVYPEEVPSLAKTFHVDVTDVGGHNYVIEQLKPGASTSKAVCSKCHREMMVEIPTAIGTVYFNNGGNVYSTSSTRFETNSEGKIEVYVTGGKYYKGMDNGDLVIESSDDSVIKLTSGSYNGSYYLGTLQAGKKGTATLTIYPKYNPSVVKTVRVCALGADDVVATGVTLDKSSLSLDLTKNPTGKFSAELSPSDTAIREVEWNSYDPSIAEVDQYGNVTAKSTGYTFVYARTIDGTRISSSSVPVYVYDTPPAPSVKASDFTVTENSIASKLSNSDYQYRFYKNGSWSSWGTTSSWSNLSVNTGYKVGVRKKSQGSYVKASDETVIDLTTKDHTRVTIKGYDATCEAAGLTDGVKCSVCNTVLVKQTTIPAKGHKEVTDQGYDSTCTATGLTAGKHCSVCDKILTAQSTIPAKGHKPVTDAAKAETCTEDGLTEGSHCSVCGEVLVAQQTISAKGHRWNKGVVTTEPTCQNKGVRTFTCYNCGETYTEDVNKLDHNIVLVDALDPTCTEKGHTAGAYCSECGEVFTQQTEIPCKGHSFGEWQQNPDDENLIFRICSECGEREDSEHRWDAGTVIKDSNCTETGEIIYRCQDCDAELSSVIPAKGHKPEPVPGYDSTCTTEGLTTGLVCSVCHETIKAQEAIGLKEHSWNDGEVTQEADYDHPGTIVYTCTECGATATEEIPVLVRDGWMKEDGNWYYYTDGFLYDDSKIDLLKATLDGITGWYKLTGGKVDRSYTGFGVSKNGTYYVEKGLVKFVTSIVKNPSDKNWYYINNGKQDLGFTGFATNQNGTYYCQNGIVKFITSIVKNPKDGNWYYINNGKQDLGFTGFATNQNGTYYCLKGMVQFITSIEKNPKDGKWYYINKGKQDLKFIGFATNKNGTYYCRNGVVQFITSIEKNPKDGKWYYINNGKQDLKFTGIAKNQNGSFLIQKGVVNFNYNGTYTDKNGKKYTIKNGKVVG